MDSKYWYDVRHPVFEVRYKSPRARTEARSKSRTARRDLKSEARAAKLPLKEFLRQQAA
jgi:hypothetical protein